MDFRPVITERQLLNEPHRHTLIALRTHLKTDATVDTRLATQVKV
jgi:hypothetical protein